MEPPELNVARAMRDYARQLRSLATSTDVAKVALVEETKYGKLVDRLEAEERASSQKQLELSSAA